MTTMGDMDTNEYIYRLERAIDEKDREIKELREQHRTYRKEASDTIANQQQIITGLRHAAYGRNEHI